MRNLMGVVYAVICTAGVAGAQNTIWVDAINGSDALGDGSSNNPWATINTAILDAINDGPSVSNPQTIRIRAGQYDHTHEGAAPGVTDPFPIEIPSFVELQADDASDPQYWPRIGGGISSSDVEAVLLVNAAIADRDGIEFRNIHIVGELQQGRDGPSAVVLRTRTGFDCNVDIDTCVFEAPVMDDPNHEDRPTVAFDLAWGAPTINFARNTIGVSPAGGVVTRIGPGTSEENKCEPIIYYLYNSVVHDGSFDASTGLEFAASGNEWVHAFLKFRGNTVDASSAPSGFALENGIRVSMQPAADVSQQVDKTFFSVVGNTIRACNDGIEFKTDSMDADTQTRIVCFDFQRNDIRDCAAAGVRLDRGTEAYGGYMNVEMKNNLLAGNQEGLVIEGFVGNYSAPIHLTGNTIVDSVGVAIAVNDDTENIPGSISNCIVYYNDSGMGGPQHGGSVAWGPSSVFAFQANNWETYLNAPSCDPSDDTTGNDNVDFTPGFTNRIGGDYGLMATACSRNKGSNSPNSRQELGEFDIDKQDRVADDHADIVDQGADEYHP